MELRQLEQFLVLTRTLSFTKAAAELFVVQSAVSQQITRLEQELGVRLFDRTSRRVTLTEAGELLKTRAEALVRNAQDVKAEIGDLAGVVSGMLRLGISQGVDGAFEVADLLVGFRAAFPAVRVAVRDNRIRQMINNVHDGELDVAFVVYEPRELPRDVVGVELTRERLVVVVRPDHPLARRGRTSLADLAAAGPILDPAPDTHLHTIVDRAWSQAGVTHEAIMEIADVGRLARYAAVGLGAALVPKYTLDQLAATDGPDTFVALELSEPISYPVTCIYRRSGPSLPATREFIALLATSPGIRITGARQTLTIAARPAAGRRTP